MTNGRVGGARLQGIAVAVERKLPCNSLDMWCLTLQRFGEFRQVSQLADVGEQEFEPAVRRGGIEGAGSRQTARDQFDRAIDGFGQRQRECSGLHAFARTHEQRVRTLFAQPA